MHVQITLCCPASFIVVFLQSQLVHPNLSRLRRSAKVAHTDDHGLYLTKRGITHDRNLVLRAVLVVLGVEAVVACRAFRLCTVAGFLQSGKDAQRHIEHVLLGPHGTAVLRRVAVVVSLLRELQGNLVFVVVRFIVATQTHEDSQLIVSEAGDVLLEGMSMHEHLDVLVLAQVERGILIHGLRLSVAQIANHHRQRLLVALYELRLRRVGIATDARWQYIVDGCHVVVLLDVHSTDSHLTRLRATIVKTLLVDAPIATHEEQRTEAHHHGMLETGEEHTHEAYRREVVDGTHALLVVVERDAELIPCDATVLAVTQRLRVLTLIDDVVATYDEVFGTYRHLVLIVFLIFVQRVVLVDVLHVGQRLVAGVVTLGA